MYVSRYQIASTYLGTDLQVTLPSEVHLATHVRETRQLCLNVRHLICYDVIDCPHQALPLIVMDW